MSAVPGLRVPPSWRPHLAGLALTLCATPATLGLVLALNRISGGGPAKDEGREVTFAVEAHRPPPPPPPPEKSERRPQKSSPRAPLPPAPNLAASLSGVDLDLPTLDLDGLAESADALLGDMDHVVHTEDTVDRRPVPRLTSPIEVPAAAKARNLAGHLLLSLLIGPDGAVKQVRVLEADPPGVFDQAVVSAVRTWVFEPATYRDRPVEVWATLPIEFQP